MATNRSKKKTEYGRFESALRKILIIPKEELKKEDKAKVKNQKKKS